MFKNKLALAGKMIKKKKIRDDFYVLTLMVSGFKDSKNFPHVYCRGEVADSVKDIPNNTYITVNAKLIPGKVFSPNGEKVITKIVAETVNVSESLSSQMGFNADFSGSMVDKTLINQFEVAGIVEKVITHKNGAHVILMALPEKVSFTCFLKDRQLEELKTGDLLCLKGIIQTRTDTIEEPETDKISYIHKEKCVISQMEKINTSGFLRQ